MASLVARPNGDFWLQINIGSSRKTIRLGGLPRRSAEEFRRRVETINALRIAGLPPDEACASWLSKLDPLMARRLEASGLIPKRPAQTLYELLNHVFLHLQVKASTRTSYENVRRNLLTFFGVDKRIGTITPGDCEEFVQWLSNHNEVRRDGKMSKATVVGRTRRARQFFNTALRKRWIVTNPFSEIRITGGQTNEDKMYHIPLEHIEALMPELPNNEYRLIVALGYFAGLRVPSEPLSLRWEHVNWQKGTITIPAPKTGTRVIPIFERLKPYLEQQWDDASESPWVISRHRCTGQAMSSIVTRAIGRAGIPLWPKLFQNMRSTAETNLMARFPVFVVCKWIGNNPRTALKHYMQVTQKNIDDACGKPAEVSTQPLHPVNQLSEL